MAAKRQGKGAAPEGQHARARSQAQEPEKLTKDQRIQHIITMMVTGVWVTGQSAPALAHEWGLSPKTIEGDSAEASRRIKHAFTEQDREELRARFVGKLEGVLKAALQAGRFEAAKGILELEGKALGHFEPEKLEVSGNLSDLLQIGLTPSGDATD